MSTTNRFLFKYIHVKNYLLLIMNNIIIIYELRFLDHRPVQTSGPDKKFFNTPPSNVNVSFRFTTRLLD